MAYRIVRFTSGKLLVASDREIASDPGRFSGAQRSKTEFASYADAESALAKHIASNPVQTNSPAGSRPQQHTWAFRARRRVF